MNEKSTNVNKSQAFLEQLGKEWYKGFREVYHQNAISKLPVEVGSLGVEVSLISFINRKIYEAMFESMTYALEFVTNEDEPDEPLNE